MTITNDILPSSSTLENSAVLHISGEDALDFLQSLTTNDVASLAVNQGQLNSICNAKGRLFAIFYLVHREHYYQIVLPKNMLAFVQQRLTMYILRSKLVINSEVESLSCLGLCFSKKEDLPLSYDYYFQLPHNPTQYICVMPKQQSSLLLQQLRDNNWQSMPETQWNLMAIEAGIPSIQPETKEKFTPQQVNLDLIGGVSFSKGCYPGQEVVARLHYLGKASRRMSLATIITTNTPHQGENIITQSGDIAGHIVCSQQKDAENCRLLVSLKLSVIDSGAPLFINDTTPLTLINTKVQV